MSSEASRLSDESISMDGMVICLTGEQLSINAH